MRNTTATKIRNYKIAIKQTQIELAMAKKSRKADRRERIEVCNQTINKLNGLILKTTK